ncbi:MAG: Uma2 family endonuclease [Chloroflexota bacterium]|nr:Uma2 family endonuclease [Chloroflexota bacterium]
MTIAGAIRTTIGEFERLIESPAAERRLELIDGELIEKPMPTQEYTWIADNLSMAISPYLRQTKSGRGGPEIRFHKPEDHQNNLLADWSFTLFKDSAALPVTRGAVPAMPDFAVEVQSPDDSIPEMRKKAAIYLALGTRLVWIVLTRQRVVIALWANGDEDLYTVADTFDFGDLLPGFSMTIADVFAL